MARRVNRAAASPRKLETSLGPALERHGPFWTLDLSGTPILHGLSVLSRALGERVIDHGVRDRIDINVERKVSAQENPELLQLLGVVEVKVSAEHDVVAEVVNDPVSFQRQLRCILGTLQRDRYRNLLFPGGKRRPTALVFNFRVLSAGRKRGSRFVLERVLSPKDEGQSYLRITIEDPHGRRLNLKSIPHMVVRGLESRTFIAGTTRIAQTMRERVLRAAERGARQYLEERKPHSYLYSRLADAGLGEIERFAISWGDAFVPDMMQTEPSQLDHLIKRVFLALEDRNARRVLGQRNVVKVVSNGMSAYLDQAELGRVLHMSLGQPRERIGLESFLERMPAIRQAIAESSVRTFAKIKVFLIHHITAEVLGLIAALRQLGCRDLEVLFVTYAGEVPDGYLGPLLDLPPKGFSCAGLANVPEDEHTEGHYRLSTQYSKTEDGKAIDDLLGRKKPRFIDAMRAVAVSRFVKQLKRAIRENHKCLIIEDGGYLAPYVNEQCLKKASLKEFLSGCGLEGAEAVPLGSMVSPVLIGSVEHTRSGFDRLREVETTYGRLAVPAFSIAVSRLKIEEEAFEVAVSLLNAIENVLHASGRVLSRRHCLVIGSRGAVGRQLMGVLSNRLQNPSRQLFGVDLVIGEDGVAGNFEESKHFDDLPEERRLSIDLIIGATGRSVLKGAQIEQWLLEGRSPELVIASGSTKTQEFSGLTRWLDQKLAKSRARIGEYALQIVPQEVIDPQTGRLYGHRYHFKMRRGSQVRERALLLLAKLTPVNFLFYGVPTEVTDQVLAQLLSCAIGLASRVQRERVAPCLYAVDRDITACGKAL